MSISIIKQISNLELMYSPERALSAGTLDEPLNPQELRRDFGLKKNFFRFCSGVGQPKIQKKLFKMEPLVRSTRNILF